MKKLIKHKLPEGTDDQPYPAVVSYDNGHFEMCYENKELVLSINDTYDGCEYCYPPSIEVSKILDWISKYRPDMLEEI